MHICLVHRDLHQVTRGGINTVYVQLTRRFLGFGHRVTLLTQESARPVRIPGATVLTLPRTDNLDDHRSLVAKTISELDPDVVECSSWEAEGLEYLAMSSRAPVVVRGEVSAVTMGAAGHAPAEAHLLGAADAVLAVSAFAARDLARIYQIPAPKVIYNGVDHTRFAPSADSPAPASGHRVVLGSDGRVARWLPITPLTAPWGPRRRGRVSLVWVGKITPMKGWDRLEALVGYLADVAQITVLLGHSAAFCPVTLTGDGDITILHDLDDADMPAFYRGADYLLSTSRWEGFGLAIAEAIACGTPALLPADLGTAAELLAAGGGATYDSPQQLRHVITKSGIADAALPAAFDWDAGAAATLTVYQSLIGR